MKNSEIRNVSRILTDMLDKTMRLSNKLTLAQAELDLSEIESEELSENLEDFLNDLAGIELSLDEMEEIFVTNIQARLIDVIGEELEDDGVYRD